jgi:hypothetical protein
MLLPGPIPLWLSLLLGFVAALALGALALLALIAALGWVLMRKVAAIFDAWLDRAWTGEEDWVTRRRRTRLVVFSRLAVSAGVTLTAGSSPCRSPT